MAWINFAEVAARAARRRDGGGSISGKNVRRVAENYLTSDFGFKEERLRVFGDAFQQLDVSPVASSFQLFGKRSKRDSKPVGCLAEHSDDLRRELNGWGGGRSLQWVSPRGLTWFMLIVIAASSSTETGTPRPAPEFFL